MPGMADPEAQALLNDTSAASPGVYVNLGSLSPRFLALFTAAPLNSAGTGGTEVTGGAYARPQIGGVVTAAGAWTTASTTITLSASVPAWITALGATPGLGVSLYDNTIAGGGALVGQIASVSGAVVTLQAAALVASQGASDLLQASAFGPAAASVGPEPGVTPCVSINTAQINLPQSTAAWGNVLAWAIYDNVPNMRYWDYLGGFPWLPATCSLGSPAFINVPNNAFAANAPFAVSAKAGGNYPTFSSAGGLTNNTGTLLVLAPGGNNITAANAGVTVISTSTGDFSLRGIAVQAIPINTTPQFAAGSFTIYMA